MATVIGVDESKFRKFTCHSCCSIVQYRPSEDIFTDKTDDGCRIRGLSCPACGAFHRTNP